MYIQKAVCEQEQRKFQSKVDLAVQAVEDFEPVPDTHTHVLVDSWYLNKRLWKAVRGRQWDLSGGLKANHKLRLWDPLTQGWQWQRLDRFAAQLCAEPFEPVLWPSQAGEQRVWACLIRTRIKKLGVCQVLIARPTADAPVSQTRFYLTTRLEDTLEQVVETLALRWKVETLFEDFKELMGSDHYQLRSAEAIRRFWALGLCLYHFPDRLCRRLESSHSRPLTLGETLAWLRQRHLDLALGWIYGLVTQRMPLQQVQALLAPALPSLQLSNC
jgi:hypothetical protein